MKIRNSIPYFSIILFCLACKHAEVPKTNIDSFSILEVKGNPQKSKYWKFKSIIRSILHDSKGNYWFGSDNDGICKYDGKYFTYFSTDNGLSNNQIRTIQEDTQGHI